MTLEEIHRIIDKFADASSRAELVRHYMDVSRKLLLDEGEINHKKLQLLCDLKGYDGYDELADEVLSHKVLQTQALVLDLVGTDYTAERHTVYKPERWAREIVRNIAETFDFGSPDECSLFGIYNQKLLDTFCDIFVSEPARLGTGGNQLLLNLTYYRRFVQGKIECDFDNFFKKMRSAFREECYMSDEKLEEVLGENVPHK
jgi:hypothetical protein